MKMSYDEIVNNPGIYTWSDSEGFIVVFNSGEYLYCPMGRYQKIDRGLRTWVNSFHWKKLDQSQYTLVFDDNIFIGVDKKIKNYSGHEALMSPGIYKPVKSDSFPKESRAIISSCSKNNRWIFYDDTSKEFSPITATSLSSYGPFIKCEDEELVIRKK